MKRVICISGDAASGKTTAAKRVLARLPGWNRLSTGQYFREFCAKEGIDPQQIPFLGDDFHRSADEHMRQTLINGQNLIAEARLVGYLARDLADALRVYCECPLDIRAARHQQREMEDGREIDLATARREIRDRDAADTANLYQLHGVDYHNPAYYHLTLDTHALDPDQVAQAILEAAGGVDALSG